MVRLAANPAAATVTIKDSNGDDVLAITAIDQGETGNAIRLAVDYGTPTPNNTFNLTVMDTPSDPSAAVTESFNNLSMNSADPRYVVDLVNGSSGLVRAEPVASSGVLGAIGLTLGQALSGTLTDPLTSAIIDDRHNAFKVAVNGLPPVTMTLSAAAFATATLSALCTEIQRQFRACAGGLAAYIGFSCSVPATTPTQILLKSAVGGESSTVRISPADRNDATEFDRDLM